MASQDTAGKPEKRRLGRGLSSLLATPVSVEAPRTDSSEAAFRQHVTGTASDATGGTHSVQLIELNDIKANPNQPRKQFTESSLRDLASSIRSVGVMQPVLVRERADGGRGGYVLVAGERRWRAAALAGLTRIPALVVSITDVEAAEWALIENLQREDLNPMDRAEAFGELVHRHGLTQLQVAERLGLDRANVANFLRLNTLDEATKEDVRRGNLTYGHARALLIVESAPLRRELATATMRSNWSVRELEKQAQRCAEEVGTGGSVRSGPAAGGAGKPVHVVEVERELSAALGLPVQIYAQRRKKNAGKVVIAYANLSDFEWIASVLKLGGDTRAIQERGQSKK